MIYKIYKVHPIFSKKVNRYSKIDINIYVYIYIYIYVYV